MGRFEHAFRRQDHLAARISRPRGKIFCPMRTSGSSTQTLPPSDRVRSCITTASQPGGTGRSRHDHGRLARTQRPRGRLPRGDRLPDPELAVRALQVVGPHRIAVDQATCRREAGRYRPQRLRPARIAAPPPAAPPPPATAGLASSTASNASSTVLSLVIGRFSHWSLVIGAEVSPLVRAWVPTAGHSPTNGDSGKATK